MSFLVLCPIMEGNSVLISTACQTKYSFYINLGKSRLKNQRIFISSILATIKKSNNNFIFFVTNIGFQPVRHYQKIKQCCYFEKLTNFIPKMVFQIQKMSKFYHTRFPHIRIIHFWGHFRLLYGYNLPHTPLKPLLQSF